MIGLQATPRQGTAAGSRITKTLVIPSSAGPVWLTVEVEIGFDKIGLVRLFVFVVSIFMSPFTCANTER